MKTPAEFAAEGLPLTIAVWMRLQSTLLHSRNRLKKDDNSDSITETISNFCQKIKRGSKKYRQILYNSCEDKPAVNNLRTVNHFSALIDTVDCRQMMSWKNV